MLNPGANMSGDGLSYLAGSRWTPAPSGRWSPHMQFLVGGAKLTWERTDPELKAAYEKLARGASSQSAERPRYLTQEEASGLALSAGGGLDLRLNRAMALRLASLEYRRWFLTDPDGRELTGGLRMTAGIVLRMGTW